ncbi:MAG: DUF1801 domain-containing protein [Acidobacteria bacterium]|nr:DUF1801 domain-containing protein [Acidobacteriota bacterium]
MPEVNTVDEYLAALSEPARSTLYQIRSMIRSMVPAEATEIISYRIPTFRYKGALVGFAAFPKHCSLFVMSSTLLDKMQQDVKGYRTSKGTIQFPPDKPLPASLIRKIVKARLLENKGFSVRKRKPAVAPNPKKPARTPSSSPQSSP